MTKNQNRSRWAGFLWQAWLPIAAVAVWFAVSADSSSPFWPPLADIFSALVGWATEGTLWSDLAFSFGNYFLAIAIAIILGFGVGIAIGLMPRVSRVLDPYLDYFRALPMVTLVPLVILVLGVGAAPKVFLIAGACVWPILLNCVEGVRSIQPSIFEAARAYRIPLALRIRKVVLPGALPQAVVGVRLAITIGLVMLVVSEMYGSTQGVGYFILDNSQRFRLAETWAGTILIGVIGWAITAVYAGFEHRLLAWHRQEEGAGAPAALTNKERAKR